MLEQVLMNCLSLNCITTNRVNFMVNRTLTTSFDYVNRTSYLNVLPLTKAQVQSNEREI